MIDALDSDLIAAARAVIAARYRPGRHALGCALRTRSGRIHLGVHLECHVGRVAVCAEAIAIGRAATEGDGDAIAAIVTVRQASGADARPAVVAPCGMCREMLSDYAPDCQVIVPTPHGPQPVPIAALLPNRYTRVTHVLRPMTAADTDAVAAIWHASASLPQVGVPDMPSLAEMRARMEHELAAGWDATLAVVDGAIAGFIALKPAESVVAELFIHPAYLGHGLGRALMDHAKAALPAGFTLYTRKANAPARRFYEKAGMAAFREAPHPRDAAPIIFYAWTPPGG